ncbi:hypothetical protein [Nocardia sp. NPDC051750]|uniref:hypothetical protein n=1 Tax=Nocardia sp. NPDC051750 TaxID=3364325 RepID=UPI003795F7AF
MNDRTLQSRWHIAADGSVIKSYPKALDHSNPQRDPPSGLKYLRYTVTRRLELSELYALDENLARSNAFFDRLTTVLRVPVFVVGVVLAWLVLPRLGLGSTVVTVLLALFIPLVVVGILGVVLLPAVMRSRFERIHLDGGFESSVPEVLGDTEARALIDAPGVARAAKAADPGRRGRTRTPRTDDELLESIGRPEPGLHTPA